LDALIQLSVESIGLDLPPTDPLAGARYIVGPNPSGDWTNHENKIAAWQDGAWIFYPPREGWIAVDIANAKLMVFNNSNWQDPQAADQLQNMEFIGINTSADSNNRLAVASPSSLFSHHGDSHRVTINKASQGDTASVVFQNNDSGRAEFGLTGSDLLSLKVSVDGSVWKEALLADPVSGHIEMPNRPIAKATLGAGWVDSPAGSQTGFNGISINQGGFSLGADITNGPGKYLIVPVTGHYSVTIKVFANAGSNFRFKLIKENSTGVLSFIETNESAAKAFTQETSSIMPLNAGDQLYFEFSSFARCYHAVGHTEIFVTLV